MTPLIRDRIGVLAMTAYALGALSFYLPHARVGLETELFFLLPPVWAGAVVHEIIRRHREDGLAPRRLAAAALGTGLAVRVVLELFHAGLAAFNIHEANQGRLPIPDPSESDLPPEFALVLPYMALCALLSIANLVVLPKLLRNVLGWRSRSAPST